MVLQGANCLRSDSVKYEQISIGQLVANASLIAAAPDLLQALQNIARSDEFKGGTFVLELQQLARDAIAKATGVTP